MKFNFKKTLFYSFIFGLLSIGIAYVYIYNYYKKNISQSQLGNIVSEIKKTNSVSDDFIKIYCKVNNYKKNKTTNEFILKFPIEVLQNKYTHRCACFDANYGLIVWNTLDRISLGIQLDEKVGTKKCLDYYLNNIDFTDNKKGVFEASRHIYNKDLNDLTEIEMIELSMISENPFFYNKNKRPEIVKIRLNEVLERINYSN